jgi:hypothetical protein
MTLEQKMRTLAQLDAGLQGYLYNPVNNTFRWFDTQQIQGYLKAGTCVSVMRVGTVPMYAQTGRLATEQVRIQIDVRDLDSDQAKVVAAYIDTWLGTVSFMSSAQFDSPPATPTSFPNFKLNQRNTTEFQVQPVLAWTSMLEYRIYNNLDF